MPLRGMVCGDPEALSLIENVAERAPTAPGVNVKVIVQVPAAAIDVPHSVEGLVEKPKSLAFVPLMFMALMVRVATPGAVSEAGEKSQV